MATSQHSALRAALKTVFTNAGHTVFSYNPGDRANSKEYVYLQRVSATQDFYDIAGNREETLTVDGRIYSSKSGASDSVAKAAEDAALAVLEDLETSLAADPTLSDEGFQVELVGPTDSDVVPLDNARMAIVDFVVQAVVIL